MQGHSAVMAGFRLALAAELPYGVALKLTPELKEALLAAHLSGQAMSMRFAQDQAENVC